MGCRKEKYEKKNEVYFEFRMQEITFANVSKNRDVAQPGSAHVWGACGRWFESSRPDKQEKSCTKVLDFLH